MEGTEGGVGSAGGLGSEGGEGVLGSFGSDGACGGLTCSHLSNSPCRYHQAHLQSHGSMHDTPTAVSSYALLYNKMQAHGKVLSQC